MAKAKRKDAASRTPSTKTAATDKPMQPFSLPPPHLEPFYSTLNTSHIYITHIDRQPYALKRRLFIVPVVMNIAFAVCLLWRLYTAIPTYFSIVIGAMGYQSEQRVDVKGTSWGGIINIIMGRTGLFLMDWALARFILPWPLDFFFGRPSNPVDWRRKVGFRDMEIIVRVSRQWNKYLKPGWVENDEATLKEIIMPALGPKVHQKVGYLLMDKHWDLDFAEMVHAHAEVHSGKLNLDDFEKTVWIHSPSHGWSCWKVDATDSERDRQRREKIVIFKDRLTAMGKENLFYRWVELIQYESTQPGGFGLERQEIAMKKAKKMFEDQGVDFEQFWQEVGGTDGLPGMDR